MYASLYLYKDLRCTDRNAYLYGNSLQNAQNMYSSSRNGATPFFLDIIKQRDHKYATPPPRKQFYVFLATAPTGVLTAGTAEIRRTVKWWERCCTFMEKGRRCTIAGITVHKHLLQSVLENDL